jgi:hypothetical protein
MRLEFLLNFIVPLTFLAIWALTSLLNRDAQPLPPRPGAGRAPGPSPLRGGVGGGFASSGRTDLTGPARATAASRSASSAVVERPASARWSSAPVQGRAGGGPTRPGVAGDDGIVILESETRPQRSSSSFSPSSAASNPRVSRAPAPSARRATSRARSAPAPSLNPIEPDRPRALTGLVGQSMAQKRTKPLDITPLATPMSPLSSPLTQASAAEPARDTARTPTPTLTSGALRAMLASPARLREVALLGELLQPPVSLRGRRRLH